jgi:NAD(P) transhydrogenase
VSGFDYDVLVIGSGPAGEAATINACKHGLRAAVIESQPQIGGNCTHKGTIPSKVLRHAVHQQMRFNANPLFRHNGPPIWLSYQQLIAATDPVIRRQVAMRGKYYQRNHIDVHYGKAVFIDKNTLRIVKADDTEELLTAKKIIIASGSRPYRPDDINFSHSKIFDADTILDMKFTPRTMIIYGAGVIGCEYASIFSGLGIKVDLINSRERLLSFLDDEISDALSYQLRDHGVMIRHREEYSHVEADDQCVTMHLKSGKKIRAEALLFCNGRTGNTDMLNLPAIGIEVDHRGYLSVDQRYATNVDNVFAAGDVIGWPSLASAAYDQGRAASYAARNEEHINFVSDVATGIYTIPEISCYGKTERELTEATIPYEVGRAFFKEVARAQISGEETGMLKLLFHPETLEILGIHCFGAESTEIVPIGQAIMKQAGGGNNISYFAETTFNYPTMAEAYRIAALNGLNRLGRL